MFPCLFLDREMLQSEFARSMPMSWSLIGWENAPFRLVPSKGQYAAARRHEMRTVVNSLDPHSSAHNLQGSIDASVATCELNGQFRD
jgi:hypothetical protein